MKANKILSLILAVAMIFGTMTTAVFADSTEVVTVTSGEKYATIAKHLFPGVSFLETKQF